MLKGFQWPFCMYKTQVLEGEEPFLGRADAQLSGQNLNSLLLYSCAALFYSAVAIKMVIFIVYSPYNLIGNQTSCTSFFFLFGKDYLGVPIFLTPWSLFALCGSSQHLELKLSFPPFSLFRAALGKDAPSHPKSYMSIPVCFLIHTLIIANSF